MGLISTLLGDVGAPTGGLLGQVGNGLASKSNSLLGFAAGGPQGMIQGAQVDAVNALRQKTEDEKKQKIANAMKWAEANKIDPAFAQAFPDQIGAIAAAKYTPKQYGVEDQWLLGLQKSDPAKFNELMQQKLVGTRGETESTKIAARLQAGQALGLTGQALQTYALTGKNADMENRVLAGDRAAIYKAEDENIPLDNTISTLNSALELNDKTFVGAGAGTRGAIGSTLPDAIVPDWYADKKTADNTSEFGKIMSMEAIKKMTETLKGATTDRELERFVDILSDPSTPPPIRARTIQRMKELAERKKQLNNSRVNELRGGTYFKPGGGGSAQPQIIKHPSGATIERLND